MKNSINRRDFLQLAGAGALASASLGGLTSALTGISAQAATTDDYRALVCVFLLGGMDNWDTVIPYDQAAYDNWARVRAPLLSTYGDSRNRSNLLHLSGRDNDITQFALPPQLPGIHALYQQGKAAVVGNVGPLIVPTDRLSFESESVLLPPRLFSHNDQQATWMSS